MRRLLTLPGRRSNYGNSWNSWNSFINGCLNRFAMNSMHGVAAIYILMRRILVLSLRLQIVNRRAGIAQPTNINAVALTEICSY
jgi:hypothetical protein